MWQKVLIIVLVLALASLSYYHYTLPECQCQCPKTTCPENVNRLGLIYQTSSEEDEALMKEVELLIDLTRPYYCGIASDALKEVVTHLQTVDQTVLNSYTCIDFAKKITNSYVYLPYEIPSEIKKQLMVIIERVISMSCTNAYPDRQKMINKFNDLYKAFCSDSDLKYLVPNM